MSDEVNVVQAVDELMCQKCTVGDGHCDFDQMVRCVKHKMTVFHPLMGDKP